MTKKDVTIPESPKHIYQNVRESLTFVDVLGTHEDNGSREEENLLKIREYVKKHLDQSLNTAEAKRAARGGVKWPPHGVQSFDGGVLRDFFGRHAAPPRAFNSNKWPSS